MEGTENKDNIKPFFEHINDLEEEIESANNIQNLVFVPQGCSYFLDTTTDQQHTGLITQGCGPCACIIVRNRDNTKMIYLPVVLSFSKISNK